MENKTAMMELIDKVEELMDLYPSEVLLINVHIRAKRLQEKEKQQVMNAYIYGYTIGESCSIEPEPEDYYNQTYLEQKKQ